MALRGTGSATAGWSRPINLTQANYPIVKCGWVYTPVGCPNTSWFGLGGANALTMAGYFVSDGVIFFDVYDDTGAEAGPYPQQLFTPDGKWHHWALMLLSQSGPNGNRIFLDGVEVGLAGTFGSFHGYGAPIGNQTFTSLNIGVAPSDGSEFIFDTASAMAELTLFTGGNEKQYVNQIKRIAAGQNPLAVVAPGEIRAYYPLKGSFRDHGPERLGMRTVNAPGDPVWIPHPAVDPIPRPRRLMLSHVAAALAGTGTSSDSASGSLSTGISLSGTTSSTNSATGDIRASDLASATTLSRNSAVGTLSTNASLQGVGQSSNSAVGALATQPIPLIGRTQSSNSALGVLTIPTVQAPTSFLTNLLVDALFRGQPLVTPTTWYFALITQLGSPSIAGIEVGGASYLRASIPANLVSWSGTQGVGTTAVSEGQSQMISNNVAIAFPAPLEDWGSVVGYEIYDALTAGNRWLSAKFENRLTILGGSPAKSFAINALSVGMG